MTLAKKLDHLVQVKQALADKYARRAEQTQSQPLRKSLWHKSIRYRRQAANMATRRKQLG